MERLVHTTRNRAQRQRRVRARISGTSQRPRLSVHISNAHVSVQAIDDTTGKTLLFATTAGSKSTGKTMTERAAAIGAEVAKKAKTAKITSVVLDRGDKLYHGRVKALAEAARAEGLEF